MNIMIVRMLPVLGAHLRHWQAALLAHSRELGTAGMFQNLVAQTARRLCCEAALRIRQGHKAGNGCAMTSHT